MVVPATKTRDYFQFRAAYNHWYLDIFYSLAKYSVTWFYINVLDFVNFCTFRKKIYE